jgi:DNA-binding response OmpR family regulator
MSKKILAVDDDTATLELLTELLGRYNYDVKATDRADEVLDIVNTYQPDLILLDINLGQWDGTTICSALKAQPQTRHIPIIFISGHYNAAKLLFRNPACAPDDFVMKPFNISSLLSKIQYQLLLRPTG